MQKEDVYAVIFFAATGSAVLAVIILRHFAGINISPFIKPGGGPLVAGIFLSVAAAFVCALNMYLSFICPRLYKRKHGTMEQYDAPSGLPVVGGFFIMGAAAFLPESLTTGIFLLILYIVDTGGLPWIFIRMLRHSL